MAPRHDRSGPIYAAQGNASANEDRPPASTFAAQIVDNLSNTKAQKNPSNQAILRQLLREILDADQAEYPPAGTIETNIEVNQRLIYVISRAGLDNIHDDNPFEVQKDVHAQALDSLSVIDLTIRRCPDVLFSVSEESNVRSQPTGPVFLWLVPQMINLLEDKTIEEIRIGAEKILRLSLSLQRRSIASKTRLHPIFKYIQGCIKDLLLYLEASPGQLSSSNDEQASYSFKVPTRETVSEVCPQALQQDELYKASHINLQSPSRILSTILHLMAILFPRKSTKSEATSSYERHVDYAWAVEILTRSRSLLRFDLEESDEKRSSSLNCVLFLRVLGEALSCTVSFGTNSIMSLQVSTLLYQSVRSVLLSSSQSMTLPLEYAVCWSISDLYKATSQSSVILGTFYVHLQPLVQETMEKSGRFENFGSDLQHTLKFTTYLNPNSDGPICPTRLMAELDCLKDPDLKESFKQVLERVHDAVSVMRPTRPRKMLRLSETKKGQASNTAEQRLIQRIYTSLGVPIAPGLEGLNHIVLQYYLNLSESDQCSLFMTLGHVACAAAAHTDTEQSGYQKVYDRCWLCDEDQSTKSARTARGVDCEELILTITNLLTIPQVQRTTKPRVAAMKSLRRILSHTDNSDYLELKRSTIGQWCLQALHSSLRDLRIAAGQTLTVFLEDRVGAGFIRQNRVIALDVLRTLSRESDVSLQETCVLAWGQIAGGSKGEETNIVLLQLVEHLGHPNALISGLAFDELLRLSEHSSFMAMRLFDPYWRTVATTVVKDLYARPQIIQRICDLLNIKVPDFLILTQTYTIPYLISAKKRQVLQRIADARSPEYSIWSLCTEPANMAATLAYLLLQPSTDVEHMVMASLYEASPEFKDFNLEIAINSVPIPIACELLKVAGEEDEEKKTRAYQAISFLAGLTHRRSGSSKGSTRKSDMIGSFFETFVLGILALLSETMNDTKGPQPTMEKRRCLGAVREMIRVAKSHICNGLPQICASLRSAIDNREFCNDAFDAWMFLLRTLGEEDIEPLVDPTFAIIAQYWEFFEPTIQERAYESISQLLKSHASLIREMVNTIPSLASIPLMAKFEDELGKLRAQMDTNHQYQAFSQRCQNENATVVTRALIELESYLLDHQDFIHTAAISEQPDPVVAKLTRSVLDSCIRFSESSSGIAVLCAKCLGLIGSLDPTRIEATRESKDILVLSNFGKAEETKDFVVFLLQETLVKAFLSATDTRLQGFLSHAMQELLKFCNFDTSVVLRSHDVQTSTNYRRWVTLPESVRNILTPFLTSKYFLKEGIAQPAYAYPIYRADMTHSTWLRTFTFDMLRKGCGENASVIFAICRRIVRDQDISISSFLLPYAVLNVILGGTEPQKLEIANEFLIVLSQTLLESNQGARENIIQCSQSVFQVLDYLSKWMQEKRKDMARSTANRATKTPSDVEYETGVAQIASVGNVLSKIPAEIISRRAVDCKSYARALFHWEQYIRQHQEEGKGYHNGLEPLYERLQEIYTQIDEPDGIEGISAHLQVLNIDQQVLEHRKAGRWTAVQSWYELLLTERPHDLDVQLSLLTSLKESGQHDVLLNQIEGFEPSQASILQSISFATEASWVTGKWDKLTHWASKISADTNGNFNVGIGAALVALHQKDYGRFTHIVDQLRHAVARSMSIGTTLSFQACHDAMLKFHVLTEVEIISGVKDNSGFNRSAMLTTLNQRLDVLGVFSSDKQYLLGLRRAAIQLSRHEFSPLDLSSAWLVSAKLARKGDFSHQAFNAVLHASQVGDQSATIEHSRLLWREGSHRKAIQSLEGAIAANAFRAHNYLSANENTATNDQNRQQQQNLLTARAHLLLAKWIDRAGQTQSDLIIQRYKKAVEFHSRWEKGHYYLGKHYNKLLESEKAKAPAKQAQTFITGETAKLVVENYLRSLAFGAKYIYQTLPRILTLWLELGTDVDKPLDPRYGNEENFRAHVTAQKRKLFGAVNSQMKKYIDRLPAFVFYTAFAQIVARICHTNQTIYASLTDIIVKVVLTHPQQALWTLLAMVKSSSKDRMHRGLYCMTKVMEHAKKMKTETAGTEVRTLMAQGQKLSEQLLRVCEGDIPGKPSIISISRDLGFNHKTAPCRLVIPLESTLTASLPTVTDNVNMKIHKAFSKDTITISTFLDDVLVLSSLQRPRKISIRGSDGRVYGLLCKPKDDLRKDQRLMEFNAMINRSLKRDAESSKRRLYIKTYAVTPLNEECGLIEWVDNLKTLRDILLRIYKQKNVIINYSELRTLLEEASSDITKIPIFTIKVLSQFPPVFHEWFVEMFPEPSAWFAARLKYTRSCAVMSMVGHVLGLGDRHGENILFEEGTGGTLHVDFNCLFDKGATFEKPEVVPFRLTHNMVDAFGAYGAEGPFRKSCELTLEILRGNEDTLMTILETFLYDPTTDFIGKKKRGRETGVPDTPEGVLERVGSKVRGLLPMESVPLSVEGYVDELVRQATDPMRLASMYIGWCPFF